MDKRGWGWWVVTWGPACLIMAVIFWLSSLPNPFGLEPKWYDEYIGITGHFGEYALLALAWRWALARQWPDLRHPMWLALALTFLYALSDEFHQSFVPNRFPDLRDVATDMAGAAVGLWLWRFLVCER